MIRSTRSRCRIRGPTSEVDNGHRVDEIDNKRWTEGGGSPGREIDNG